MPHVPLSEPTLKRLEILFSGEELKIATELLENECGSNLLFCENYGPVEMERLRFAAMKQSCGDIEGLCKAIELAKTDWRDLLMAAGFGHDISIHKRWMPRSPDHGAGPLCGQPRTHSN